MAISETGNAFAGEICLRITIRAEACHQSAALRRSALWRHRNQLILARVRTGQSCRMRGKCDDVFFIYLVSSDPRLCLAILITFALTVCLICAIGRHQRRPLSFPQYRQTRLRRR